MILNEWAHRWGIPLEALADLRVEITRVDDTLRPGASEASAQQRARLEVSRQGGRVWRNNVGACEDPRTGRPLRYGLCNDSSALNKRLKSSDLIGITPITVVPGMVGHTHGIFTSIEVKRPGWRYTGRGREAAQLAWLELVAGMGGIARFSTGEV